MLKSACSVLIATCIAGCASTAIERSHHLADESYLASNVGHELQLLLAVAAYRAAPTQASKASLLAAINRNPRLQKMLWSDRGLTRVAYSPDGRLLASGSADGKLTIFDVDSGQPIIRLAGAHQDWISRLAFSPEGDRLLSIGENNVAKIWRVANPLIQIDTIDPKSFGAGYFVLSPDWKRIGVSPEKREDEVEILDLATRGRVARLSAGHRIDSVTLNRDGTRLLTIAEGYMVLWDLAENPPRRIPLNETAHSAYDHAKFSPDDALIATPHWGDIYLWDAKTGRRLEDRTIRLAENVETFEFSGDGKWLAAGTHRGSIEVFRLEDGRRLGPTLGIQRREINSLAFDPRRGTLASASFNSPILLWGPDAHSPLVERTLTEFNQVFFVQFDARGESLLGAEIKNTLQSWNVGDTFKDGPRREVKPFNFRIAAASRDGRLVATAGQSDVIYLWETTSGKLLREFKSDRTSAEALALSAEGDHLAASGSGGQVELWNLSDATAAPVKLSGHADTVSALSFSADGATLASSDGKQIQLWNAASGAALGMPLNHLYAHALAFSPDGMRLASSGDDMRIRVWDVRNGTQIGPPLVGHKDDVVSLAYSADGKRLFSSGRDAMILIWEEESILPLALRSGWFGNYPYSDPASYSLSLDAGGRRLAAADGVIRIWNASDEAWVERACALANRNFYRYEWRQFMPSGMPYAKVCPALPEPRELPIGMDVEQ